MRLLIALLIIISAEVVAHYANVINGENATAVYLVLLVISFILFCRAFYHDNRTVWLWMALSSYAWASYAIYNDVEITESVICEATIELTDFPKRASPSGEKARAKIVNTLDCPALNHANIMIRAYRTPNWQLNNRYHAKLKFSPSNPRFLGTQKVDAYASLQTLSAPLNMQTHTSTQLINTWRFHLSERIHARYSEQTQRWWQALLIGHRGELGKRDWQILRHTGTAHLLAISGLHLAIVAGMAFWLLQIVCAHSRTIARYVEPRSVALVGALLVALIYGAMSGAQPPVMRAWVMFAVYVWHWFYAPLRSGIQALLITAIILLLTDVYLIFSVSAWLSFYATAVVILSYRRLKHYSKWRLWLTMQAVITIALWPLVWALFGGISLIGYVVNVIVVPWLGVILMLGYLGLLMPFFTTMADDFFSRYLATIHFFAEMDGGYWSTHWQPTIITAFFVCTAMLLWLMKTRYRTNMMGCLCMLCACVCTAFVIYPRDQFVVLQPSPLLGVMTAGGQTYVINAGYRGKGADQVETTILPYLRKHALTPDAIIITDTSKRATTALVTLLAYYPDIKLYGTVITKDIPFAVQYCPQDTEWPLTFIKSRHCAVVIADKWHITDEQVRQLSTQDDIRI